MSSQNTNTPSKALVDQLEKAIKAIDSKKHEEAQSLLDTLSLSCRELGDTQIQSVTQKYLSILKRKKMLAQPRSSDAMMDIQIELNRRNSDQALSLINGESENQKNKAKLHYLKSLAFAQKGDADQCSLALNSAIGLDKNMVFLWRLEPDAQEMRKNQLFAFAEED
jgi:hypothetical protein